MLKGVLFDMDGVLIDSEPLHAHAFMQSMREFGLDLSLEYCYQFIGRTDRYMAEYLIENFHLSCTVAELLQAKNNEIKRLEKTVGYKPIPYIGQLVRDLKKHGIATAIASSSPMPAIMQTAQQLNLTEYFDCYISGMDLPHSKPEPDIFLKAASMISVSPHDCLVIEDSENGVKAAKAAGMICIGFINPSSGNQNLSLADFLVEGFEEIDTSFLKQVYQRARHEIVTITETKHFIIRELSTQDIPVLKEIYDMPQIRNFVDDLRGSVKEEQKKHEAYIHNIYEFYGFGLWGVFDKESMRLVGQCGIQPTTLDGDSVIEIGYCMAPSYQGKGYAYECSQAVIRYAYEKLDINLLVAYIDQHNYPSIALAKRLGMTLKKELNHKNKDCYLYILKLK